MVIHGENAKVSVGGIDFVVNGDIELSLERDILEYKERGKVVIKKVPSKHLSLSGEVTGTPVNGVWQDVLRPFLGADTLDTTTELSSVALKGADSESDITIEFDWGDGGTKVRLTGVVITGVSVSAPQDDAESITLSYHANGIQGV